MVGGRAFTQILTGAEVKNEIFFNVGDERDVTVPSHKDVVHLRFGATFASFLPKCLKSLLSSQPVP